jgi:hypothetical protein
MKTVASPYRNYELKKSYKYLFNLLLFYLNDLNFSSEKLTFFKLFVLPPGVAAPTQSCYFVAEEIIKQKARSKSAVQR